MNCETFYHYAQLGFVGYFCLGVATLAFFAMAVGQMREPPLTTLLVSIAVILLWPIVIIFAVLD